MDQDKPLIQQDDPAQLPWYKRKVPIIAMISAAVVIGTCILLVVVISIAVAAKSDKCAADNWQDCLRNIDSFCQWCYTAADGSGHCGKEDVDPDTGLIPSNCAVGTASLFLCHAYGFGTNQDEETCVSYSPKNDGDYCEWKGIQNCYEDDGNGPIGCCF